MVGKRSRRRPRRESVTGFGLVPVGGVEADPTGSCWVVRPMVRDVLIADPLLPERHRQEFDTRFVSSLNQIVGDPQRSGWFP